MAHEHGGSRLRLEAEFIYDSFKEGVRPGVQAARYVLNKAAPSPDVADLIDAAKQRFISFKAAAATYLGSLFHEPYPIELDWEKLYATAQTTRLNEVVVGTHSKEDPLSLSYFGRIPERSPGGLRSVRAAVLCGGIATMLLALEEEDARREQDHERGKHFKPQDGYGDTLAGLMLIGSVGYPTHYRVVDECAYEYGQGSADRAPLDKSDSGELDITPLGFTTIHGVPPTSEDPFVDKDGNPLKLTEMGKAHILRRDIPPLRDINILSPEAEEELEKDPYADEDDEQ